MANKQITMYTIPNTNTNTNTNTGNYCNNCGTFGHGFNTCKFPITSIGIIAFRYNISGSLEYLLICRKHTIGYIEFMRGKYTLNNRIYIRNIISEMTINEKNMLLKHEFDVLWNQLWGDCIINQFRSEEKSAHDKFDSLKLGIMCSTKSFNLKTIIEESDTNWEEPEWGFPKGRHNNLEKDLNCGLREFSEETGYQTHIVQVIQNILPYEEIFTGSNYKSYKHKYYIGYINRLQEPSKQFQETEISKIEWCTYEKAVELIRPYNLEKLDVLHKVNTLLNKYNIYEQ